LELKNSNLNEHKSFFIVFLPKQIINLIYIDMKKLITFTVLAAFVLPSVAQVYQSYSEQSEQVPLATVKIAKNEFPQKVITAVNTRFDKNNPLTWSKFPYTLKEYGWLYEVGSSSGPLTGYEVTMKTNLGANYWALYNSEGNLLETREASKNIPVPKYVMEALAESSFKDWAVVGDREVTSFYPGDGIPTSSAKQHFRLTVEKDGATKHLGFRYKTGSGKYQAYVIK
jgi:hypothetical protein